MRMPVAYLPHGGGPWPFVEMGIMEPAPKERLLSYLRSLRAISKIIAPTLSLSAARKTARAVS